MSVTFSLKWSSSECEKVYMYVGMNAGADGMDRGSHTEQQRDKEES